MKKVLVETTMPVPAKKMGWRITAQRVKDILILNSYKDRVLYARHCINVDTGEFMTFRDETWTNERIERAVGFSSVWWAGEAEVKSRFHMSQEDEKRILEALQKASTPEWVTKSPYNLINHVETERARTERERKEKNRVRRVKAVMDKLPALPVNLEGWIDQRENEGKHYAIKDRESGKWSCTGCGKLCAKEALKREDGKKNVRNNDWVICPSCGRVIRYYARKTHVECMTHFALVQPVDDEMSVVRHFDAFIYGVPGRIKTITLDEAVRIVLWENAYNPVCSIYYNQYGYQSCSLGGVSTVCCGKPWNISIHGMVYIMDHSD